MKLLHKGSWGWLPSFLTALTSSFYFVVILPVQSYHLSDNSFPYSLNELLGEFGAYFVCALVLLTVVLACCHRFCGRGLHLVLLIVVICAIVESSPLAAGLPELDGDLAGYCLPVRKAWDAAILMGLVFAAVWFHRFLCRWLIPFALVVIFYASCMLADSFVRAGHSESKSEQVLVERIPREDVFRSVAFSPKKNIMVLILDAVMSSVVQDIFAGDKSLQAHFPGFVNYVNNIGMHPNTSTAIPGLMTGSYFERSCDLGRFSMARFSDEAFFYDYWHRDVPVFINAALGRFGCTNRPKAKLAKVRRGLPSQCRMHGQVKFSIIGFSIFRVLPYCLKAHCLMSAEDRDMSSEVSIADMSAPDQPLPALANGTLCDKDGVLWRSLAQMPICEEFNASLHVHHSEGGHLPVDVDENGRIVRRPHPSYVDYRGKCKWAVKNVAEMFDVWRTNGIYDVSTIILLGDHGSAGFTPPDGGINGVSSRAFPLLMVKTAHDNTPYAESRLPTSHARVAELVRALCRDDLARQQIEEILKTSERLFRCYENGEICDYLISADGKMRLLRRKDEGRLGGELHPLEVDKEYSFRLRDADEPYPDFILLNGRSGEFAGVGMLANPMFVTVRVPDANTSYSFDLLLRLVSSGEQGKKHPALATIWAGESMAWTEGRAGQVTDRRLTIQNVKSDDEGLVQLCFSCHELSKIPMLLTKLKFSPSTNDVQDSNDPTNLFQKDDVAIGGPNRSCFAELAESPLLAPEAVYSLSVKSVQTKVGNEGTIWIELIGRESSESGHCVHVPVKQLQREGIHSVFRVPPFGHWALRIRSDKSEAEIRFAGLSLKRCDQDGMRRRE